jgi:predicted transcriptional regulator
MIRIKKTVRLDDKQAGVLERLAVLHGTSRPSHMRMATHKFVRNNQASVRGRVIRKTPSFLRNAPDNSQRY